MLRAIERLVPVFALASRDPAGLPQVKLDLFQEQVGHQLPQSFVVEAQLVEVRDQVSLDR